MGILYRKTNNKGSIGVDVLFIGIIILMGVVMVQGATPTRTQPSTTSSTDNYTVDPNSLTSDKNGDPSLQLKTFGFIKVLPPTPSDNECNEDGKIISGEPRILFAISPNPGGSVAAGGQIKIWYNDESPLPLGLATTGNVQPTTHLTNAQSIINAGFRDSRQHLPVYPALFLTDITNNASDTSGDVENGGTPHPPDEIWGDWQIVLPSGTTIRSEDRPNMVQLPAGADPFPATSNVKFADSALFTRPREPFYGAEAIWNVDGLGLTTGHSYRAELLIHDGDQNFGGDIGEACTTIQL